MITNHSIFENLSDEEIKQVTDQAIIRNYKKNHILIFQDSPVDKVYIVKNGLLKAFRMYEDKELILGLMNKHSIIGELELFADEKAISSIEVMEDAEIYSFTKNTFNEIASNNSKLMKNIFKIYNQRFKQLNSHIQLLSFKNVFTRVCSTLINLSHFNQEGDLIIEGINQTTIGNIASTTRESVSKTLNTLQKEGILQLESRKITIFDIESLSEYANSPAY